MHGHTLKTDPTQASLPSATAEATVQNPRHKHTQTLLALTLAKHRNITPSQTHCRADTQNHTPSAGVLSSDGPFRLVMLEICPFFRIDLKRHRKKRHSESRKAFNSLMRRWKPLTQASWFVMVFKRT